MASETYHSRIKKLMVLQTFLLLALVILLVFFVYRRVKPEIIDFTLEDECGPIGGGISHSIETEEDCTNACYAACLSVELELHNSEMDKSTTPCYTCSCECT